MGVEPFVSRCDQAAVKRPFAFAALVARYQQDCFSDRIEGDAPDPAIGIEPQLLHVGVPRPAQRIDPRPAGGGPKSFDDPGVRQ